MNVTAIRNPYQSATEHFGQGLFQVIKNSMPVQLMAKAWDCVYDVVFVRMFARLYLEGPAMGGYGFWEGRSPESICSVMTGNDESFWLKNKAECEVMISKRFNGWIVLLEMIFYMYFLIVLLRFCIKKTMFRH